MAQTQLGEKRLGGDIINSGVEAITNREVNRREISRDPTQRRFHEKLSFVIIRVIIELTLLATNTDLCSYRRSHLSDRREVDCMVVTICLRLYAIGADIGIRITIT